VGALGVVVTWAGYALFVLGFSKVKSARSGTRLSLSDVALPSHRAAYMAAAALWNSSTNTNPAVANPQANLPGGQTEANTALVQAKKDATAACSKYGSSSPQCTAAKKRVSDIASVAAGTPSVAAGTPRYTQWLNDLGL